MIKKRNMEVYVWAMNRDAWIAVKGNARINAFRSAAVTETVTVIAVTGIGTGATGTSATMTEGMSSGF